MSGIPYRSEIDGLRAIAILAVVFYHANFGLRAGLVGVDVFFVISGYLITSLLLREWDTTNHINLFNFYARRVRRLFPALILVVISVLIASSLLLSPFGEIREVAQSAAASLLFVGNFFFQIHTGGYFSPSAEHFPLLNMWSLGVEEQFYLFWPLGLLFILRWRRQSAFAVLAVCGVASLVCAETLMLYTPTAAFYEMPARFWELALGGLIALCPPQKLVDGRVPATVGVVIVLASTIFPIQHFPGIGVLPAVIGSGFLLYAVHGSTELGWIGAILRSQPMVFFGLISYSLYLWHWPLFALARVTRAGPIPIGLRILLCLAAVALAWLSYRFVERPFRRPQPGTSGRKVVAAGMVAAASLAFASVTLGNALNREPAPTDLASRTAGDFPQNRFQCNYREDQSLDDFPRSGCASADDKPVQIVIWGDSYALAWQPFAWVLAQHQDVAAMEYSRDGCPPVLDYGSGHNYLEKKRCIEFNMLVFGRISGIGTLIFAADWPNPVTNPDFYTKFDVTVKQVAPLVKEIILLGPTPNLRDPVPDCIRTHHLSACAISYSDYKLQSDPVRTLLRSLAAKYKNIEYVELSNFFCNTETCPALKDGYGLYWDSHHVSTTAARAFSQTYLGQQNQDSNAKQVSMHPL
ncbi:MAG: acyltransferase family protein [Gammaproteobacteria bacterium]